MTEPVTPINRYAGAPITDDDATIAAALEDVSVPALLMSMVHMTGDPRYLRLIERGALGVIEGAQVWLGDHRGRLLR